jgi:vancomycin aglycone glucosyltransferase
MRILLSTYGSRGDVQPLAALAVQLRALGAEVRVCAPPDEEFAELLAGAGAPLTPVGWPVRTTLHGITPPPVKDMSRLAEALIAAQFRAVAEAAEGCDALVAAGMVPVAARSVAEKLGIRYVYAAYSPTSLPSPHHPPLPFPGRPCPPEVTDNRARWARDADHHDAMFAATLNTHRAALGLAPVTDVRHHILTGRPWLAADAALAPWREPSDLDVVQTGAWLLPDHRPLPAALTAFLDAGAPPVYVGFGSMRAPKDIARVAIDAIRARGHRVLLGRGWADLTLPERRDDCHTVGEVNQQVLFTRVAAVVHHGGAGTTTAAARAGAPQIVVPQMADQPYWADRVAGLGIGAAHDVATPTVASLSVALETALAPRTRDRARTVAAAVRPDGAVVAAQLLLHGRDRRTETGPAALLSDQPT